MASVLDRAAAVSSGLTGTRVLPWRVTNLGGPLNTLLLVHLRRMRLRARARQTLSRADLDVTVVIGARDRAGWRLRNALRSLRGQDYKRGDVKVIVVDYGSGSPARSELRGVGWEFDVRVIRVDGVREWNRSRCLNIGIRSAVTPLVMCSDVDVVLPPDYLTLATSTLDSHPLGVVYPRVVDLPPVVEGNLRGVDAALGGSAWAALKALGEVRSLEQPALGLPLTYRWAVERIRGFDEAYRLWGLEDDDLAKRLQFLGLKALLLGEEGDVLHQWHPKFTGVADDPGFEPAIQWNRDRFRRTHTILRNGAFWGARGDPGTGNPAGLRSLVKRRR